jgi:hypothetical protein
VKFRGVFALSALILFVVVVRASAISLDSGDGLKVTFSDQTGGVTAVSAGGVDAPLIAGQWGGLTVQAGRRLTPSSLVTLRFEEDGGWKMADNGNWDAESACAARKPGVGVDGSGGLLLGNGSSKGVGMALAKPIPVSGGNRVKIRWQARVGNVASLQIVAVRVFDAAGADITARTRAPRDWAWTNSSKGHAIWAIACAAADTWQQFEYEYPAPESAASMQFAVRYWTGGDGWVTIDNVSLDVLSGIQWGEAVPVSGPIQASADGFTQSTDVTALGLHADVAAASSGGKLDFHVTLQDISKPAEDRALLVSWSLPVAVTGWRWWDDLDTPRTVESGTVYSHVSKLAGHLISQYPYSAIDNAQCGLSLAVPMEEVVVQRFECDASAGLRSVWEIALSPVTTKLGPGRASFSCSLYAHDPAWGLRSATARYQALYPQYFEKRPTAQGGLASGVHPGLVPRPEDFGWAFNETEPIDSAEERGLCAQLGMGIYHEIQPWVFWLSGWDGVPVKPTYEERVAHLKFRATNPDVDYVNWHASGGVGDSGHLLLSDGVCIGAGMATLPLKVEGGSTLSISWQQKVHDTETAQIVGVRIYDANDKDITQASPKTGSWWFSPGSQANAIWSIRNKTADQWETCSYDHPLPPEAAKVRVSIRHWNSGDHRAHIDNVKIRCGDRTLIDWNFDKPGSEWVTARGKNWENPANMWSRELRRLTAQTVVNSSPLGPNGEYLIDRGYLCRLGDWGAYSQGWPVNPDPDIPSPNAYQLFHDKWVLERLDEAAGVYIQSVMISSGVGDWENRRRDHLAVTDAPLTFSWTDGGATQVAPQPQQKFLRKIAAEIHASGKLMMLNLFSDASRFHAHTSDVLSSEVFQPVEGAPRSRVRRALAGQRVVTSLLQYNLGLPVYASAGDVEKYIRDQLFWGFFPSISSIGGPMNARTPEPYFKHLDLSERDRPVWQRYMPVVRLVSTAGWEPITSVRCSPSAETERFGDFARGPVYLTLRGAGSAAYEGEITVDLPGCGLSNDSAVIAVKDVLSGNTQSATRSGRVLTTKMSIPAGDVRVLQLEAVPATQAN